MPLDLLHYVFLIPLQESDPTSDEGAKMLEVMDEDQQVTASHIRQAIQSAKRKVSP